MPEGTPMTKIAGATLGRDPSQLTLGHLLAEAAGRHPEREAIVFEGRRILYRELDAEVQRVARCLVGAGVVKGARVALLMSSRPEWIFAAFATSMVGGVLVPINTYATPDELDYILRHSDASLLLMQRALLRHAYLDDLLTAHPELSRGSPGRIRCAALPQLRRIVCLDLDRPRGWIETWNAWSMQDLSMQDWSMQGGDVSAALIDALRAEVTPSDDACIIYTSGSTGRPKGVLHAQRAAAAQSWRFAEQLRLDETDRVWTAQPFFWTAGICMSLGATLASGACLLLQDHFDPGEALELMEKERATTAHAWAHQHKALGDHPSASRRDFSSLQKVAPTSPLATLAGIEKDEWGPGGAYGLTETFTIVASLPADAPAELRRTTSGRVLPGMTIRILDPEDGSPQEVGASGEIAVKGVHLMRGYTKAAPEEVLDEDGFFRTGDAGWMDEEGYLHWTGRISNMIKTRGANVSPVEIERQLEGYTPLRIGVPLALPHPTLGEAIILCAVRGEGEPVSEEDVRSHLRSKLASYKVPKRVLFFSAEELSLTGNQKIQLEPLRRAALARLEQQGAEIDGHIYQSEES